MSGAQNAFCLRCVSDLVGALFTGNGVDQRIKALDRLVSESKVVIAPNDRGMVLSDDLDSNATNVSLVVNWTEAR